MKTPQFDKLLEAKPTQRYPPPTLLPPRPRQIRTGVIRTVDKHGACLDLIGHVLRLAQILRPYRRRQAEWAVIHVFDGGNGGGDGHDGDDGPESLVAHDGHGVVDVGEEGGFDVVAMLGEVVKGWVCWGFVLCAGGYGVGDLREDRFFGALGDDGADLGGFVHGVADLVFREDVFTRGDEGVVDVGVDVDALDGAAGLPRVEDGAVDDFRGRPLGVDIWSDVGGIFAAELETDIDYSIGGCFLDGKPSGDGTGEADVVNLWGADDGFNM
jgi:hypothetical protein